MTNISHAIAKARKNVSQLERFSGQFRFSEFDPSRRLWIESNPMPYGVAVMARRRALIAEALRAFGWVRESDILKATESLVQEGGRWDEQVRTVLMEGDV